MEQILEMLKTDPESDFLLYTAGLEYQASGQFLLAENYFRKLYELHPEYLPLYYQFGKMLWETGKGEEAKALFLKGISLSRVQKNLRTERELQQLLEEVSD